MRPRLKCMNLGETPLVSHRRILILLVHIYVIHRRGRSEKNREIDRNNWIELTVVPRCVKGDTFKSKNVHFSVSPRVFNGARGGSSGQRLGPDAHHGLVTLGEVHVQHWLSPRSRQLRQVGETGLTAQIQSEPKQTCAFSTTWNTKWNESRGTKPEVTAAGNSSSSSQFINSCCTPRNLNASGFNK